MSAEAIRIAMWSGPRNISTAMLRSWGNRADTFVTDEPLYAAYLLHHPEVRHPGREEVLAQHETDWQKVVAWLSGAGGCGKRVWYQKHMAHHLVDLDLGFLDRTCNVFLIRDPCEMLPSLTVQLPHAGLSDTGLKQQWDLFDSLCGRGQMRIPSWSVMPEFQ